MLNKNNYMQLIKELAGLDRCHCGPEMEKAYESLIKYYPGSRLIKYPRGKKINHWIMPPFWQCKQATLKAPDGTIIASKERNHLEVFTYSPPFSGTISLNELQEHLMSDPKQPNAIPFHFRNQYRHWNPEWGFSIPHSKRKELKKGKYEVNIESSFSFDEELTQADYHHQGELNDEFIFIGHFDHPSQVNDGLAGCIAAFEIIERLKGRKTKYSYRAFASVEIAGSVMYLSKESNVRNNLIEALFLGLVGINSSFVYQQSFGKQSILDQIIKYLFEFSDNAKKNIYNHRELVGNDENIFDSVGYNIPTGTLMRWPFPEYHTNFDNMDITYEEKIEETIQMVMKTIDIIENDRIVMANFKGVPCMSNPSINLYLGPDFRDKEQLKSKDLIVTEADEQYLNDNSNLLYSFMNNVVRLADGNHTIFEISEKSKVPFSFAHAYIMKMQEHGLIRCIEK